MAYWDARRLDAREIDADLCIVGAGAAGIAMALEYVESGHRVVLVESGDFRYRRRTQRLYLGRNTGRRSFSTNHSRFRAFGGSTTRWGGQCRPLDPIDFERREAIPHSGWPFGSAHLVPFYRRAQEVCNLGPYDYDSVGVSAAAGLWGRSSGSRLASKLYQFSYPANFGEAYRPGLERASDVHVYLNANLVEIVLEDHGRLVERLNLATLDNRRMSVKAKAYVLVCGGIENARLLLASNRVALHGVGNAHGLVGRFFMDHPYLFPGYFQPGTSSLGIDDFTIHDYENVGQEQRSHLALTLNEETRRREGLNGAALYFIRRERYKTLPEYMSRGGRAVNHLIDVLRHRESFSGEFLNDLTDLAADYGEAAKTLGRQVAGLSRRAIVPGIRVALEATPCWESRVTLNARTDRLGMRRVDVDWRLHPNDRRGFYLLMEAVQSEFSRHDFGRLVTHDRVDDTGWPLAMTGGKHHMGTTRMGSDPRCGVVDPQCRVHGVGNLFVAGSSVFPTAGYANPTLTIVALAIRLADYLKRALRSNSLP